VVDSEAVALVAAALAAAAVEVAVVARDAVVLVVILKGATARARSLPRRSSSSIALRRS
jgi:hypothetical protein